MHAKSKYLRIYHKNSLLVRIFITLAIFFLLMILLLGGFLLYSSNQNLKDRYVASNERLLRQTSQSLNLILENESTKLNSLLYNKDVIRGVIARRQMNYEKTLALISQLASAVSTQKLIHYAGYFVVKPNIFYDSRNNITTMEHSPLADILLPYYEDPSLATQITVNEIPTDVLTTAQSLYLIQSYPDITSESFAYLIFEIHLDALYEAIQTSQSSSDFLLYNAQGHFVLGQNKGTLESELIQEAANGADDFGLLSDQSTFYYRDSHGWLYFYTTPPIPRFLSLSQEITPPLIFFFIIILAVSIFGSFYISLMVYHPILTLLDHLSLQRAPLLPAKARNEVDYLNQAYSSMLTHQQEIEELLPALQSSLHEKLFLDLLRDAELCPTDLEHRLQLLQSPFQLQNYYGIFLIKLIPNDPNASSEISLELVYLRIVQRIHAFVGKQATVFPIRQKPSLLVTVCSFSPKSSDTQIHMMLENLREHLKNPVIEDGVQKVIGYGSFHFDLLHLKQAFHSAEENLNINQYYQNASFEPVLVPGAPLPEQEHLSAHFINEAKKIMEEIGQIEISQTKEDTHRWIEDVTLYDMKLEHARPLFQFLIHLYREHLLHLAPQLGKEQESLPGEQELKSFSSLQEAAAYTDSTCKQCLRILEKYYQTNSYRQMERLKSYLLIHYKDPNLSLEAAADYLGIHTASLSRMFKNHTNCNFWEYVNKLRVKKAKELLEDTDLPIQEIGFVTGFNSKSTFFRVFRKYTDQTPGQYRQNLPV
ncbi:helix-turn-helix transcriptional regulator [Hominifimenecus sp. rT4P-3]|uniref:helix-turn-helix transcriptional regulator n=1 Tax=Hominifimenecus sp. rT4P-3 TaxID=3242979 RepID=UPI003DA531FC